MPPLGAFFGGLAFFPDFAFLGATCARRAPARAFLPGFGWAVAVAVACVVVLRSRWRWLAVIHPILTVLVVVVTGNHYWLDGVIATVIVAVAVTVADPWLPLTPARTATRAEVSV